MGGRGFKNKWADGFWFSQVPLVHTVCEITLGLRNGFASLLGFRTVCEIGLVCKIFRIPYENFVRCTN